MNETMKLWRLFQDEITGYDTYDSMVVAAKSEAEARKTLPVLYEDYWECVHNRGSIWATVLENVKVEYLGEAKEGTEAGCICASFNAG